MGNDAEACILVVCSSFTNYDLYRSCCCRLRLFLNLLSCYTPLCCCCCCCCSSCCFEAAILCAYLDAVLYEFTTLSLHYMPTLALQVCYLNGDQHHNNNKYHIIVIRAFLYCVFKLPMLFVPKHHVCFLYQPSTFKKGYRWLASNHVVFVLIYLVFGCA